MASRLHRLENIYTRMDGLIRKGHVKEKDKPLWFDVYKSFPPKYDPTFKRRAPEVKVREIFYKEDVFRAKIQKAFHGRLGVIDLNRDRGVYSQKLLKTFEQYISEGMSEDEALEKLKVSVKESQDTPKESPPAKTDIETFLKQTL